MLAGSTFFFTLPLGDPEDGLTPTRLVDTETMVAQGAVSGGTPARVNGRMKYV
jgi:hypothetical protein